MQGRSQRIGLIDEAPADTQAIAATDLYPPKERHAGIQTGESSTE